MLDWVNSAVALGIVVRLIATADSMNGTTRHCFRLAVAVLAIVSLAYALWPLYGEWPAWMDTLWIVAVAWYVSCDKRKRCAPGVLSTDQIKLAP